MWQNILGHKYVTKYFRGDIVNGFEGCIWMPNEIRKDTNQDAV